MTERFARIGLAVTAIWLYNWCLVRVIGVAVALPFPSWWFQVVPRSDHGILAWVILCHTTAVVVVALPFAWLFSTHYRRYAMPLACVAAWIIAIPVMAQTLRYLPHMSGLMRGVNILDTVKVVAALPLLTLVFRHRSLTHVGADRDG